MQQEDSRERDWKSSQHVACCSVSQSYHTTRGLKLTIHSGITLAQANAYQEANPERCEHPDPVIVHPCVKLNRPFLDKSGNNNEPPQTMREDQLLVPDPPKPTLANPVIPVSPIDIFEAEQRALQKRPREENEIWGDEEWYPDWATDIEDEGEFDQAAPKKRPRQGPGGLLQSDTSTATYELSRSTPHPPMKDLGVKLAPKDKRKGIRAIKHAYIKGYMGEERDKRRNVFLKALEKYLYSHFDSTTLSVEEALLLDVFDEVIDLKVVDEIDSAGFADEHEVAVPDKVFQIVKIEEESTEHEQLCPVKPDESGEQSESAEEKVDKGRSLSAYAVVRAKQDAEKV